MSATAPEHDDETVDRIGDGDLPRDAGRHGGQDGAEAVQTKTANTIQVWGLACPYPAIPWTSANRAEENTWIKKASEGGVSKLRVDNPALPATMDVATHHGDRSD